MRSELQSVEPITTEEVYLSEHFPNLPIKGWVSALEKAIGPTQLPFSISTAEIGETKYHVYPHQGREVAFPLFVFEDDEGKKYAAIGIKGVGSTSASESRYGRTLPRPFLVTSREIVGASTLGPIMKDMAFSERLIRAGIPCVRPIAVLKRTDARALELDVETGLYVRAFPSPNRLDELYEIRNEEGMREFLDEESSLLRGRGIDVPKGDYDAHIGVIISNLETSFNYLLENRIANLNIGPNNFCAEGTMLDYDHYIEFGDNGEIKESNGEVVDEEKAWKDTLHFMAHDFRSIYYGFRVVLPSCSVAKIIDEAMERVQKKAIDSLPSQNWEKISEFWSSVRSELKESQRDSS